MLLKAAEHHLGLITAPAECLVAPRQNHKVAHGLEQLIAQRVYGLGYPAAAAAARLTEEQERNGLRDTPTPTEVADTVGAHLSAASRQSPAIRPGIGHE